MEIVAGCSESLFAASALFVQFCIFISFARPLAGAFGLDMAHHADGPLESGLSMEIERLFVAVRTDIFVFFCF